MIKSAKRAVYDQFKNVGINDEELLSAFAGAEVLINWRALTYHSADPHDVSPIAPKHFLFGQLGGQFAPEVEGWIYYGVMRRWRHVKLLVQHFWKRLMLQLIPTLNQRKKRQSVRRNVKLGEVVLVLSADVPRWRWSLERVVEVVEGDDRFVRVVKVQVGGSIVIRSITKICPLEVNEGNRNVPTVSHGRGEWTGEIFVIDILQGEKYIYGGEQNKTPWWRYLFVLNTNLPLLVWNWF